MSASNKFDALRPYYDSEVNAAIRSVINDPMLATIMQFAFPEKTVSEWQAELLDIHSTQDFQGRIVSKMLDKVLAVSSEGVTTSGFDALDKETPYLFLSNHRDIILDTSLINLTLFRHNMILTASAIGDNLVKHPFLYTLARINRNFLVFRNLSPRELLQSSKLMSEYITTLITEEGRSVWVAQREGRTKDGLDATHPGVLKMLSMQADSQDLVGFFQKLNIVPISISYEYDPTDVLKIPELLASLNNEKYVKQPDEDFNTIIKGIMGAKKRIHIHAGAPLNEALESLRPLNNANQQIKALAQLLDNEIVGNYKLWPTNYIAADLRDESSAYSAHYTAAEKADFVQRMHKRVDVANAQAIDRFLAMYANPVANKARILAGE